jgi:hypothetical protein
MLNTSMFIIIHINFIVNNINLKKNNYLKKYNNLKQKIFVFIINYKLFQTLFIKLKICNFLLYFYL